MIRVLLADDHDLVRQGIARLLNRQDDIRVIAQVDSGDDALAVIGQDRVDVAVLDVTMPGPGIFEILHRIEQDELDCSVLILTMHPEERYGVRLLRAGAAGYLSKDRSPTELAEAIRRVHAGRRYITPSLAERLAGELQKPADRAPHEELSDREFQVLQLTARGLSGTEIAARLEVSPQTVSTYRTRIRDKLGVETIADMVRYAIEHDLTD